VFSLRLSEADGGLELGVSEAVLVFQELGRAIVPGPLVASHLAAEIIPGAATGEQVVGILEPSVPVSMIEYFDDLDVLLVVTDDGVRRVDPATLAAQVVDRPLDPLSPVRVVTGDIPAGELVAGPDVAHRWLLTGAVLTGGLQVGIADRTVELATAYAKEREQFGRAIGSFQAIKHLIADMFVKAAVARAGVESAACALDGRSDDDPVRAASSAKIMADEAARFCARTCIQVHGGIGYTWEVDVQRYWKRACVLDTHFGGVDAHAEVVASTL
jgi:alkylation response protein AidB-like acyl-CoA dehydrogenase